MKAIFRKELADYFTSLRVFILFLLVYLASAGGLYAAHQGIRGAITGDGFVFLKLFTTTGEIPFSLAGFIILLIPIIGIAFGFDAINREHAIGTMSRILSQPIYRDSVINGKFLAGVVTLYVMILATMLIVSGAGLTMIGVPPTPEEIIRLSIWFFFIIIYGAFWMSLAILFSVLLRRIATSLLSAIAVWLVFSFFIGLIAPALANALAPVTSSATDEVIIRNYDINQTILRLSPSYLFSEVTTVLLLPGVRSLSLVNVLIQSERMLPNPLSLGQSLLLIWPHLTSLLSLSVICFAISYAIFMRQEIRAT